MKITTIFRRIFIAGCLLIHTTPVFSQFRKVGYIPVWSANYPSGMGGLNINKLTHLNIAFANPDVNGNLIPSFGTDGDVTTAVQSGHAYNLEVMISIGGGDVDGTNYHNLLSNNPTGFADSILNFVTAHNLDGVDVDIEGNILDGTTITAAQYESFVTYLAGILHAQNKKMTCAIGTWFGGFITANAAAQFDWINIMSYDATGPWDPQNAGPHSPYSMVVSDFQYWNTTKNVPAEKLVIGVPFYGYGFGTYANQGISYCDIVTTYPGSENTDQVGTGDNAIYYNGIPTIIQKTNYALENAGGIMIWEITEDCATEHSLLLAIDSVVQAYNATNSLIENDNPDVTIYPNPATDKIYLRFGDSKEETVKIQMYNTLGMEQAVDYRVMENGYYTLYTGVLPCGIYLLEITHGNTKTTRRILLSE